jgi:hypothetical protein
MVDTIVLQFNKNDYQIDSKVNLKKTFSKGFNKRVYNPNKDQIKRFGYLPRITEIEAIREGGYSTFLLVEFSIPKLKYGNNFEEVEDSDFEGICQILRERLYKIGVGFYNLDFIRKAEVSKIHYSKNIILDDFTTPSMYIDEIRKINLNRLLDINQSDYRNNGQSFKFRSNDFEVTFYDKLEDLRNSKISEKRSLEKDNYCQLNLFTDISKKAFEVLRMEVRIGSRKKLKSLLSDNSINLKDGSFKSLFSEAVSRKILNSIINNIELKYPRILLLDDNVESIVSSIRLNNAHLKPSKILELAMVAQLMKKLGVRGYRGFLKSFGDTYWYKLNNELRSLKIGNKENYINVLKTKIFEFKKVELEKYFN